MDRSTVKYLRVIVKTAIALGYLPHGWCDRTQSITFTSHRNRRITFILQILLFWCYLVMLGMRILYVSYDNREGITTSDKTNLQFALVAHMVALPFQLCSIFFYGHLHVLINRYLRFGEELRVEWHDYRPARKYQTVNKFCARAIVAGTLNVMSTVSMIWRSPRATNLITSVVPNVDQWPKWKLLPFGIAQFFISAHVWAPSLLHIFFMLGYAADVCNKMELMR